MIQHLKIPVANLKCSGCVHSIEKALSKKLEITEVVVDEETAIVSISYKSDQAAFAFEEEIRALLVSLGYPPINEDNNMMLRAKSFVSCAIGRFGSVKEST